MSKLDNYFSHCTKCLFNSNVPNLQLDSSGICYYCRLDKKLSVEYDKSTWDTVVSNLLSKRTKNTVYDMVIGISGGCDSSYLLYKSVVAGLRPLAVHFDNTYNTPIASKNMRRLLEKLKVPLRTFVVEPKEFDTIYRGFYHYRLIDLDIATDIGLAATMYKVAAEYNIKTIFDGHSFRTEGVCPLGWTYMDSKYINAVYKNYVGTDTKYFPHMWLKDQLYWMCVKRIKKLRPLPYMLYHKQQAKRELETLGWQDYGGSHAENYMSYFYHNFYLPKYYGIPAEWNQYSALVRNKQITKEKALEILRNPVVNEDMVKYVKDRLWIRGDRVGDVKTSDDFANYKKTFKLLKPLFGLLTKFDLVPRTFYEKYCCSTYP